MRSVLDTDFYKLLMLQMIRHLHSDVQATFSLINRGTKVRLSYHVVARRHRLVPDLARHRCKPSSRRVYLKAANPLAAHKRDAFALQPACTRRLFAVAIIN